VPPSLTLEPLGPINVADAFRVWGDFEAVKFTNWVHTPTISDCGARLEKVLAYYAKDSRHFGPYVIRSGDNRFLGLIGAEVSSARETEYEIWYIIVQAEWGKGIASRALAELVHQMAASGRASTGVATVVSSNPASGRVLEKNGFIRGSVETGGFARHGLMLDLIHFSRVFDKTANEED